MQSLYFLFFYFYFCLKFLKWISQLKNVLENFSADKNDELSYNGRSVDSADGGTYFLFTLRISTQQSRWCDSLSTGSMQLRQSTSFFCLRHIFLGLLIFSVLLLVLNCPENLFVVLLVSFFTLHFLYHHIRNRARGSQDTTN